MLSASVIKSRRPTVRSGKGGGAAFAGVLHMATAAPFAAPIAAPALVQKNARWGKSADRGRS